MSLWGNHSANTAQKPKYLANTGAGSVLADTYGITPAAETASDGTITHAGWNLVTQGTGGLVGVTVTAGGTGYTNATAITVTANTTGSEDTTLPAATPATGTLVVAAGVITGVVITSPGAGYTQPPVITTTGGSGATLVGVVGGRAKRVQNETIVAMGSMT